MKEMRRILALVLCFVMLVGILPVSAFATDTVPAETSVVETTEAPTSAVEDDDVADDDAQSTPADSSTVPADTSTAPADTSTAPADTSTAPADTSTAPADTSTAPADNTTKAVPDANAGIALASNEEDGIAVAATGTPQVVIAASDYQASTSSTTMQNIMKKIKETHSSVYGILMGGDYDAGDVYPTASHLTAVNKTISSVYSGIADENRIYIQGNHETYCRDGSLNIGGDNLLNKTGAYDTDYYGVYAINYEDFDSASSGLETYLKGKSGYTKPIFVMSHQPLHKTTRNDNNAAVNLFNVLNNYDDLNIIFLFGHNHSQGYDAYLGNGSIYLKKGDSITVAGGSTSTLNFTYMNYGYVGYIGTNHGSADQTLTMTAFEIYEDEVFIKRYDTSGQHVLKAAGNTTDSGYTADTKIYGQATLNLSNGESTISALSTDSGDDSTGSDGNTNSGTTGGSGYTYELVTSIEAGEKYVIVGNDNPVALMDNGGEMGTQSVTISGTTLTSDVALTEWTFASASSGTITSDAGNQLGYSSSSWNLTGDGDCGFDIAVGSSNFSLRVVRSSSYYSRYYFYYDGSAWAKDSSSTQYVRLYKLTGTGSGGGSTVTPSGGDWVTISSGVGGTIYTLDEDGLNVGSDEKYLIVNTSANGTGNVLTNSNGDAANTQLTITDKVIVVEDDTNVAWTPTGNSGSANFANDDYNIYLSYNNGVLYTSTRSLKVTHEGNGEYFLKRDSSSSGYYVQYSSSDGWDTLSTTENSVYLYRKTGTEAGGDAEYAKLDGELTYTIDRGLNRDAALAEVMKGINVVVSADKSAETILEDTNDNITWELASNYDGTVAGEYAVKIYYKEKLLGTARVIVPAVNVDHIDCDESGSVKADANGKVRTGANITVYYEDGTTQKIPVTVDMLKDANGNAVDTTLADNETSKTITGLKVYYNGECVCENFTLTVRAPSSYPEYPDEGAVKVNKTATGVQFQSTGVAQVEVSASGIPMNQGVDVLLVLDTSSSMGFQGSLDSGTRIEVLRECVNALIKSLKAERADGSVPDVDISVVHFNGYYDNKTVNYINGAAKDTSTLGGVLADWQNVQNLADTWASNIPDNCSGTNYDHGLQLAYEQLSEKQEQDGGTRKQFVLFMSDGAPFQYNGVSGNTITTNSEWSKWILGSYTQDQVKELTGNNIELANPEFYYGDGSGTGQKHRIAEAIKGSTAENFKVASYSDNSSSATGSLIEVRGLGATMYSVGLALEASNMPVDVAGQEAILKTIASSEDVFYSVTSAAGLQEAFDDFAGEALMAATNARFVDQMGAQYDLQMGQILDLNDQPVDVENKIEIISYDIYTRADYLAGDCTLKQIGDRKGTSTTLETITFNPAGTEAYSDKIYTEDENGNKTYPNILNDGIIYANSFWYNSNPTAVEINGVDIPTGVDSNGLTTGSTNMLPAETFYWKVGTIKTTELAMRYYVYLDGSMEGTLKAGSYPTNEYALLYYNNYLNQPVGQPCQKVTVSPVMAWDAANVSYAFYLVDENGNIIVNQTTGETGSFANKVAVTNPVVHEEVLLNNVDTVESIEVASLGVLPDGYELYDTGAVYTIEINSDATGSWSIAKGTDKATTYVTHFDLEDSSAYTNEQSKNSDADFTHTIVWFAVLWKVQALPDTVVIDYGLPVDISVLTNDMFGENGKLVAVGSAEGVNLDVHETALHANFLTNGQPKNSYQAEYGTAQVNANGKVRYTPSTMEMNGYDKFAYAANYTGATNPGYYYDTVTVIPATTVYYEDNFLTYTASNTEWEDEGTAVENATQAEDRPGQYSLTDANNIYGYDAVNKNMSTFSLGTAKKVTVDADSYATAEFTFSGTGFDVVSMTTSDTGVLVVQVYRATGELETSKFVNTYYGVVYDEATDKWVATANGVAGAPDKIYQVPVIQVNGLTYGQYTVKLTASYYKNFDEQYSADEGATNSYDLYLDAVRIYDPANNGAQDNDTVIEDAYVADGEGWPTYFELRDHIITDNSFGNVENTTVVTGSVFIDGDLSVGDDQIDDYVSYGPNNEIYLAKDQSIAFMLGGLDNVENVHLGIKSADGKACNYSIKNIAQNTNIETGVNAGDSYGEKISTVATTTDMYYNLTGWKNDIIVITNTGSEGVLSLTNIKFTYATNPYGVADASVMTLSLEDEVDAAAEPVTGYAYMTSSAAALTLRSLNASVEKEEVPETTVPETTTPETTVPEETEPETEETKPSKPSKPGKPSKEDKEENETKPTKPGKDEKPSHNDRNEEIRNNLKKAAERIKNVVTALLGKWFR